MSTSAPPEFPGLMEASVWIKLPTSVMPTPVRASAETMPMVVVCPTPKGLPIASTRSPTSNAVGVAEAESGQIVAFRVDRAASARSEALSVNMHLGDKLTLVRQHNLHFGALADDVVVGDHQAVVWTRSRPTQARSAPFPSAGRRGSRTGHRRKPPKGDRRHLGAGEDVDDRRRGLLDQWCEGELDLHGRSRDSAVCMF